MSQYIHVTHHDAQGRYRPSSWHVVKIPLRAAQWLAYCGRRFPMDGADLITDLPAAASCESCLRNAKRAEDKAAA